MSANKSFCEELEKMLDKSTVQAVCEDLAEVCRLKAEHLRENWQEESDAKLWNRFGQRFEQIADTARNTPHPSFSRKNLLS